uniref:Candidate secreted effector n=1 Tax=Meloidogyne incognita TaxID=6306 RepID=A0A914N398_MELIC
MSHSHWLLFFLYFFLPFLAPPLAAVSAEPDFLPDFDSTPGAPPPFALPAPASFTLRKYSAAP